MTWYQISVNGRVSVDTYDREEADAVFDAVVNTSEDGTRVVLSRLYEPPPAPPSGHWVDERVEYGRGSG